MPPKKSTVSKKIEIPEHNDGNLSHKEISDAVTNCLYSRQNLTKEQMGIVYNKLQQVNSLNLLFGDDFYKDETNFKYIVGHDVSLCKCAKEIESDSICTFCTCTCNGCKLRSKWMSK